VELRDHYRAFRAGGATLAALVVAPLDAVRSTQQTIGAPYPLLADPDHRVAQAYGVYDLLGDGYAAPSVFVIDPAGRIVWSYVGQDPHDRPSAEEILSHLP